MRSLLLLLAATLLVASEPSVPIPQAAPADVFAVVVVPDIRATLGRIELAAQALAPGSLPPGQLAEHLGKSLGDPGLANLGAGALLLVVGPGGVAPNAALIVPAADAASYVGAAQRLGTQAEAVGPLVVVGSKPADLALGRRIAADHATLSAGAIGGDLRILLAPRRILTAYKPMLGGFTTLMAAQLAKEPNGAALAKIVGLEVAALVDIADETEACQIDVGLEGTVLRYDTTIQASAQGSLAKAFVAPTAPAASLAHATARMGLDPGYMVMVGRYHAEGACAWAADLLERLRQRPEGKEMIDDGLVAMVRGWGANLDGTMAMRARAVGDQPMRVDGVTGIRDAARQAGLQKDLFERLFGAGSFGDVYRGMGIDSVYTENARAIGGMRVDRLTYRLDAEKLPEEEAAIMRRFLHDTEFAIAPDAILMANAPEDLDRLATPGTAPLPTAAEHAIGAGRDGYLDFHWIGMMKALMTAVPDADFMATAIAKVPPGEPMTGAWTAREGRVLWEARLPLQPFFDYGKAMQEAMMEQFQRGAEEPAPAPPENPEQVF